MPVIAGSTTELLKDGYHRLRNPENSESLPRAYEFRLRELREPKNPPLPSWKEIWDSLKETWQNAGDAWEMKRAARTSSKESRTEGSQL
jgi:hypothetical protein